MVWTNLQKSKNVSSFYFSFSFSFLIILRTSFLPALVTAECQAWCKNHKDPCGFPEHCKSCEMCTTTTAPTTTKKPTEEPELCKSWCGNSEHKDTPWKERCEWNACSQCGECPADCQGWCNGLEKDRCVWPKCKSCGTCTTTTTTKKPACLSRCATDNDPWQTKCGSPDCKLCDMCTTTTTTTAGNCVCENHGKNSVCVKDNPEKCKCKPGYRSPHSSQLRCTDINECQEKTHNCIGLSQCSNTEGSFKCECPGNLVPASKWGDIVCTDTNECADAKKKRCGDGGKCKNLVAKTGDEYGFFCECVAGFTAKFEDQHCAEQSCSFVIPKEIPHIRYGKCVDFLKDGKIHLKPVSNPTCELGCADGYAKVNTEVSCKPNNPDGRKETEEMNGHIPYLKSPPSNACVEQKCTIGSTDRFGLHSKKGSSCDGPLNALAGKQSCVLDCKDGFIKKGSGAITCGPNKDEPEGTISGTVTCIAATCPPLENIPHGRSSSTNLTNTLDTVRIICDDGFINVDGTTATCSGIGPEESDWKFISKCEEAPCQPLTVAFSDTTEANGNVGDSVKVTCTGGALSALVKCEADGNRQMGQWKGIPACHEEQKHTLWLRAVIVISSIVGFAIVLAIVLAVSCACLKRPR